MSGSRAGNVIATLLLGGALLFLALAFRRNWEDIRLYRLTLHPGDLALSFLFVLSSLLLATYGWQLSMNALTAPSSLSFPESVSVANTSGLAKYLPGKVWAFALQAHLLSGKGVHPSLPLFVTLVNLYVSLVTSAFMGMGLLLLSPASSASSFVLPLLIATLLVDLCFLAFHARLFHAASTLYGRLRGCEIPRYGLPKGILARLYLVHGAVAALAGASAYWACIGTGFDPGSGKAPLIAASAILGDVAGFLAVFVPGGLGVRESAMYLLLRDFAGGPLSLILPVATRFVNLFADLALGTAAFALLRHFRRTGVSRPESR